MASTRAYDSPDGSLRFLVGTEDDGDVSLGFDGFAWHTHADILAAVAGIPEVVEPNRTGLLVAPGDATALGGQLARLFADATLRDRIKQLRTRDLGLAGSRR